MSAQGYRHQDIVAYWRACNNRSLGIFLDPLIHSAKHLESFFLSLHKRVWGCVVSTNKFELFWKEISKLPVRVYVFPISCEERNKYVIEGILSLVSGIVIASQWLALPSTKAFPVENSGMVGFVSGGRRDAGYSYGTIPAHYVVFRVWMKALRRLPCVNTCPFRRLGSYVDEGDITSTVFIHK